MITALSTAKIVSVMVLVLLTTSPAPAEGQIPSMRAVKTSIPPVIDGKLDDDCWAIAEVATNFIEHKTERLAEEQTAIRVLYDQKNLYVGFECLEPEPNRIQAMVRKHDRWLMDDDWIEAHIDSFHDHRCSYLFMTNSLGTRYDAHRGVFSSSGSWEADAVWSCDWSVVCTASADRWFAEMAIPIGSMHFAPKDAVTWGINFDRGEKDKQETSSWSYYNRLPYSARGFGHLTGLDLSGVKVPRQLQFETYVSSTTDLKDDRNEVSTGLDISARLSPQLISAFTINPDFGQVEADPDTIELRDTERFLQERRAFFREGSELFDTPLNIYYSRRFSEIDAGAKLTGQSKEWALGLIDVQGEITREDEAHKGNYQVGRIVRYIGENSHIGALWAGSLRQDGRNLVGGPDARLYLNSDTFASAQFLGLTDSDGITTDDKVDHDAYGLYSDLQGGTKPIQWSVSYEDISRGFRPDLGYIPRRDIRGPGALLSYHQDIEQGPVKWFGARASYSLYENHWGETTLQDFNERFSMCFRNELEFELSRSDQFHAPYQNRYNRLWVGYNQEDQWHSIGGSYERGEFQNVPYDEFSLGKPLKVMDRLTTTLNGNYRMTQPQEGDENVWLWRWVTEYTFLSEGRIKFTAEQTSEKRYNLTLLFFWPFRKNLDFYLVLNDFRTDATEPAQRGIFTKVVYRF